MWRLRDAVEYGRAATSGQPSDSAYDAQHPCSAPGGFPWPRVALHAELVFCWVSSYRHLGCFAKRALHCCWGVRDFYWVGRWGRSGIRELAGPQLKCARSTFFAATHAFPLPHQTIRNKCVTHTHSMGVLMSMKGL